MKEKALKTLQKQVKKTRDEFQIGDVIRWTANGRYLYAAIKTERGWYTTARSLYGYDGNGYVRQVYDYDGLVRMLSHDEVTNIQVVGKWLP